MTDVIVAIALCVACATAYAIAALIQARYAHLTVAELVRVPVLWGAIALNGFGAALHVTSLNFGPLSLIQPLGVLTLVIAVPLAAVTTHRRATRLELTGMANTVVGLAGLAMIITTAGKPDTLTPRELTGLIITTLAVVTVFALLGRRPGASTLWEAVAGGMAFSVCSALCQTIVVTVSDTGAAALLYPEILVAMLAVATFAITATILTQRSYRNGLSAPLAVTNLANPASATIIGITLLGEHVATNGIQVLLAVACAVLSAVGVAQLARSREAVPQKVAEPVVTE